MSSYDLHQVTAEEMRQNFALVRLQVISPLSLLVSIGANVVCASLIKPSMSEISRIHPTLVTPSSPFIVSYWLVLYALQIGLCLLMVFARNENTKDTLIRGVGMRFSIANWLMAGWAVFWTMQFWWSFYVSEVLILLNVLNLISIYITLQRHFHVRHPLDWIFIHVPMRMMLVILFLIDWLDNGFIALGWEAWDLTNYGKYSWQAVGAITGVNLVGLLVVFFMRDIVWTVSACYLLVALFVKTPKTTTVIGTIITFFVLYPLTYLAALAFHRIRSREGRIRLEQEALAASGDPEAAAAVDGEVSHQRRTVPTGGVKTALPPADGAAAA